MTTALEGVSGQRYALAALYLRERTGTHCTGGWVGPRAGLNRCGKSRPPPGFDPRTVQPVASHYTDWATRPTYNDHMYTHFRFALHLPERNSRVIWRGSVLCKVCLHVMASWNVNSFRSAICTRIPKGISKFVWCSLDTKFNGYTDRNHSIKFRQWPFRCVSINCLVLPSPLSPQK